MKLFVLLTVLALAPISMANTVTITHDKNDCRDGWISMDMIVNFGAETHTFAPSCGSSFSMEFQTNAGKTCTIQSPMCSSTEPDRQVRVHCGNNLVTAARVICPGE